MIACGFANIFASGFGDSMENDVLTILEGQLANPFFIGLTQRPVREVPRGHSGSARA